MAVTEPVAPDAGDTQARAARVALAVRVFLPAAIAVAIVLGVAALSFVVLGKRGAEHGVDAVLDATVEAQVARLHADFLELGEAAAALAGDGTLAAGTSTPARLQEAIARTGFDRAIVLDAGGTPVIDSGADAIRGTPLVDAPLIATALATGQSVRGFWVQGQQLHQAAVVPLQGVQGEGGFLLLARRIDDAFAHALAPRQGSGVAFWLPGPDGPLLVAGSMDPGAAESLQRVARETPALVDALQLGQATQRLAVEFAGARWLLQPVPVAEAGNSPLVAVTAIASADAASAGYTHALQLVVLAGVASLALAALLSLWLAGAVRAALARLQDAAERALAGDFDAQEAVPGDAATANLDGVFDALLRRLGEQHALQAYVAGFVREEREPSGTSPSPPPSAAAIEPPRRNLLVLLAVEMPQDGEAGIAGTMAAASALAVRLATAAQRCGGRLVAGDGERWALGFEGDECVERSLRAALLIADGQADDGQAAGVTRPAMALADGEMISGSIAVGTRRWPALLGPTGRQLARLLCESAPGTALVARPLGERIRERFGSSVLDVATGALGGRRYYALNMPALVDAVSAPPPEPMPEDEAGNFESQAMEGPGPPGDRLRAGERIGGRYEILSANGTGAAGMGCLARDRETGGRVAVVMSRADAQQVGWTQDANRARAIDHPNVLHVLDAGQFAGRAYAVVEHVAATSLRSLMDRTRPVPYRAALSIARQLVAGLAAVHAAGLLHRDIRPEKLLVDGAGNVRLAGVGTGVPAARTAADALLPLMAQEPAGYSAPECLAGEGLDARADVYSCGALFSDMFCGSLPYEGNNATEVYLAQVRQEPRRPSASWPEVPPALERIILRCIARRREDRFQTAAELATALTCLRG